MKKGIMTYITCCNLLKIAFSITTGARMSVRIPDRLVKGIPPVMVRGVINDKFAQRTPTWTDRQGWQGASSRIYMAFPDNS
jgi:hypothetical protein